eukprot:Skav218900  [mRNA]  locus=scaffold328:316307:318591:- [translate_table: standard]
MTWREKVRTMTAHQKGALIDALTGALVVANTVVIGLSADDTSWAGRTCGAQKQVAKNDGQVCFTLGFLSEMIAKMVIQGFLVYIRDQWHWVDCALVFFAAWIKMHIEWFNGCRWEKQSAEFSMPSGSGADGPELTGLRTWESASHLHGTKVMWMASVDQASDAFALARVVRVARLSRITRVLRVSFSQALVVSSKGTG